MSGWTYASEKLPKRRGEYIVAYHPCQWDKVNDGMKVGIGAYRGKGTWEKKKTQHVVAWMPLPEPCAPEPVMQP